MGSITKDIKFSLSPEIAKEFCEIYIQKLEDLELKKSQALETRRKLEQKKETMKFARASKRPIPKIKPNILETKKEERRLHYQCIDANNVLDSL